MTASPGHFADRPAAPQDLLSELLRSVRLSGERIDAYAPQRTFSIGFADTGSLHIIEAGELALRIDADPQVTYVGSGDVLLLPRGDTHRLTDVTKRAAAKVQTGAPENDAPAPARWLTGTFTIGDPQASHLLGSLPAVIILRGGGGPALEGLEVARRMLLFEMQSPSQGSAVMVARILDLVFIQILRIWAAGRSRSWPEPAAFPGRRLPRGSALASGSHQPPISPTCALTPPPTCFATRHFRSRSSRRKSATRRKPRSAARSGIATARRRRAGAVTIARAALSARAPSRRCAVPVRSRARRRQQPVRSRSAIRRR